MSRPVLVDLFCKAGGAGMGYHRAGFEVIGVDLDPQPNYPFAFIQGDALAVDLAELGAVAVHASPPCQAHSAMTRMVGDPSRHPDLIEPTRALLKASGLPYIIENVPGAPLHNPVVLCGSSFGLGAGGRQLRRHRLFETNVPVMAYPCQHRGQAIGVYGHGGGRGSAKYGYTGSLAEWREALGIDWPTTKAELAQAIPPAYTEHLGGYLMAEVRARELAAA